MSEAKEIIRNVKADYHAGRISPADYMSPTKISLMDMLFHRRKIQRHLLSAPRGAVKKGTTK